MRFTSRSLIAALIAGPVLAGVGTLAIAQPFAQRTLSGNFDPAQLPEFKGKVAQYTLSPRGEVDGLILADGTEVQVPPFLSTQLVFSVKPGDSVSIHGLKARSAPMLAAVTVTNDASGAVVGGTPGRIGPGAPQMEATGKVKEVLHTPRGDVGGALLEDGTVLRMPPPEAAKYASLLAAGQTVSVKGFGVSSPLGRSIGVMQIGPSADKLTAIEMPHWHHKPHGPGDHGPGDHGPDGMPRP